MHDAQLLLDHAVRELHTMVNTHILLYNHTACCTHFASGSCCTLFVSHTAATAAMYLTATAAASMPYVYMRTASQHAMLCVILTRCDASTNSFWSNALKACILAVNTLSAKAHYVLLVRVAYCCCACTE
jgi:hypothetical protein